MSFFGKEVRMRRLFNKKSGKILVIALDHAVGWGVIEGIDRINETMEKIIEAQPDALTMQKGIIEKCYSKFSAQIPFIMKATSFAPFHPAYDAQIGDIEEAVRLGADAIAVGCTVCGKEQAELLKQMAKISREAASYGMPTVAHIYPKGDLINDDERYSLKYVSYAARAAAEVGIDIVKTFYTGDSDSFRKVIESCPAKVVVSGGPKMPELKDVFVMTRNAMDAGAYGVTYGRNVWQSDNPVKVVAALKMIIHENKDVDEVLQYL
ncbi:MAG: fructose-bisphosphate aldolase [Actinobacteria bacterium]|nr:fructose-bisphosphate aldolase [Actinomycetota bacterium]